MSALLSSLDRFQQQGPLCGLLEKKERFGIEFVRARRRSREAEQLETVAPNSKDQGSEVYKERAYLEKKEAFSMGHL